MHKSSEVMWNSAALGKGWRPSCRRRRTWRNISGGEFLRMPDFRRLYARIDDEARLLWEAQRSFPSPADARPCHPENPS